MKVKGRRQSPNIVDARGPEKELAYYTQTTMAGSQRARMHQTTLAPTIHDKHLNAHIRATPIIVLRNILQRGVLNPVGSKFIPAASPEFNRDVNKLQP